MANHDGISELLLLNADMVKEVFFAVNHHHDKLDDANNLACLLHLENGLSKDFGPDISPRKLASTNLRF